MGTLLNPYLHFDGNARAALEFYAEVFGGSAELSTFGQFAPPDSPGADRIMHGMVTAPNGFVVMGADAPPEMGSSAAAGYAISLSGDDEQALRGYWDRLSEGGTVSMPLEKQVWGDTFGQLTDRFGIPWMVNIAGEDQTSGAPTG
jgi:PhnB protein